MQEFIAKNSRQLYWYCKVFLANEVDYTIEHFEIKPDKVAFRLKADVSEERAKELQREFRGFYN